MNKDTAFMGPAIPVIYLLVQPSGRKHSLARPKTALQLLQALNLAEETALVIREGKLLTPDRHIWPGDQITLRLAGSRG